MLGASRYCPTSRTDVPGTSIIPSGHVGINRSGPTARAWPARPVGVIPALVLDSQHAVAPESTVGARPPLGMLAALGWPSADLQFELPLAVRDLAGRTATPQSWNALRDVTDRPVASSRPGSGRATGSGPTRGFQADRPSPGRRRAPASASRRRARSNLGAVGR